MIPVIIIDSDKADQAALKKAIESSDLPFEIKEIFPDIRSSSTWFLENFPPYLIICELTGVSGDASELIAKYALTCPFIFTGYGRENECSSLANAIGFIQKPLLAEEIHLAINKYRKLRDHFFKVFNNGAAVILNTTVSKTRMLVRKGQENAILKIDNIAYFFSDSRLTFVVDLHGDKYFMDEPLVKLQKILDPAVFFRVSKKYIVSLNAVKKFRALEKGKIELTVLPEPFETIIVSQYSAPEFRNWIQN